MINCNSTHAQYEGIKQMYWYQQAEEDYYRKLHTPVHWWGIVWQKSKKWVECVKCGLVASEENLETECK